MLAALYDRVGVEISEPAADVARRRGITIVAERDLDDTQARAFEGFILSDVFEHLGANGDLTAPRRAARAWRTAFHCD